MQPSATAPNSDYTAPWSSGREQGMSMNKRHGPEEKMKAKRPPGVVPWFASEH